MTEHNSIVEKQRMLLEAETWALGIKTVHAHSLHSMWYDTRPEDTAGGKSVLDREYNSGLIERYQGDKLIHTFGKRLKGQDLLDAYRKQT